MPQNDNEHTKSKGIPNFLDKQFSSSIFSSKEIAKMLYPLLLDTFFIHLITMLTTSMISSSGESSVAAVSMINPLTSLIMFLLNASVAGGTVVVAQCKGRGDMETIRKASGLTVMVTVGISIVVCLLMSSFSHPIVNFLYGSADMDVKLKSYEYLSGVSISLILYSLYSASYGIFRGLGENKICLKLTIIINLTYFIFSFFFLNIFHWDIKGTVWALILARGIGAAGGFYYLFMSPKRSVRIGVRNVFQYDHNLFRGIMKISIPFISEQIFFYGGTLLATQYMVVLGTTAIAANAVANSAFSLVYAASSAVGNLGTTVIGQCIGAGEKELARWYTKKLLLLSNMLLIFSLIVYIPFRDMILTLFHPTATTLPVIHQLMWIAIIPMPFFWAISNTLPYCLKSAGDAVYSSVVSLSTMWVIKIGLGYFLAVPMGFGVPAVWVCSSLEWAIKSFFFIHRYRGNAWLNKKTLE